MDLFEKLGAMLELRGLQKEVKKVERQQKVMTKLRAAIDGLQVEALTLPEGNLDHALTWNYVGHRECNLELDWLLIYKVEKRA